MSEEDVRARLREQGYATLAADPDAPRKIKAAAAARRSPSGPGSTSSRSTSPRIDARPER